MSLLFPLFSFVCGLLLASTPYATLIKTRLSSLLARGLIPIVIIYNMVFYREGSMSLMLLSLGSAILLFSFYSMLFKDRLQALCFSYTNIAWLGFPVAIALFGPEVSAPMIALYIGGSLFGNVWAVSAVSSTPQALFSIIRKVIQSPPVIALGIALLCRLLQIQNLQQHQWIDGIYNLAKWGMSFTGMCVLGMWLRHTRVAKQDLIDSSKIALLKMLCGAVICALVYVFFPIPNLPHAIAVLFLLFCLPPAANIVALETHYQGTGTSAKYIAAGTMVSCLIILIYALVLQLIY
ncbi:hypothetical protein EC844_10142 [Acinetobacter calcoaceticus]|uniref:Permease n=1 Tax=Acinetobacter calcoaceticus TaxID=471 RepID=A0A4R1YA46_ACICA|nr:hypothetical protein EC844_10142 [Acinetobacter calcoaceticus]